ncbi:DPS1 [Symbiodinium sp. CCMP2592]|nr:DPS1 [Symbiodinium sp. CCMP2592]
MEKAGQDVWRKTYPHTVRWLLTSLHHLDAKTPSSAPKAKAEAKPAKATAQPKAEPKQKPAEPKAAPKEPMAPEPKAAAQAAGEEGGSGKKEEKRKAKEAEKKAKEDEKRRKEEERIAAQNAKFAGPDLTPENFEEHSFGNLFIQSQKKTGRQWTNIGSLKPDMKDSLLWIRARVHNSRKQGNKLCFLTLRQDVATVQAVIFGQEMAGFAGNLPDESVVDVCGKVACPDAPITSCTVQNVELAVERVFCIGRSQALPLQLADASRSEAELEKDPSLPSVGQDVRLDNRIIDLRTVANQAVFRMQSGVCMLFREFLLMNDFQEIHTPKLIGGASEGGVADSGSGHGARFALLPCILGVSTAFAFGGHGSNPFQVLGLRSDAEDDDVRPAFRQLAKIYHPDVPETGDEHRFRRISWAAEELSTAEGRRQWRAVVSGIKPPRDQDWQIFEATREDSGFLWSIAPEIDEACKKTAHQEAADFPTQAEAPFGEYVSCLHMPLQSIPMHDAYMGSVCVCVCARQLYSETEGTVCWVCSRFWMLQQPMQLRPTNKNHPSTRTRHPRLLQESLEDDAPWIKEPLLSVSSPFLCA